MERIKAIQTGLVWLVTKDLTEQQVVKIKHSYSYPDPNDDLKVFETFIELKDKIGVPGGDKAKLKAIVPDIVVQDNRIQPKFKHKKKSILALRDYQEDAMQELEIYFKENGTTFNLTGEPGARQKFHVSKYNR